jgi:hypothetical protein
MTSRTNTAEHVYDNVLSEYITQIRIHTDLEISNYVADATIRYDNTRPLSTVFSELVREVNDT